MGSGCLYLEQLRQATRCVYNKCEPSLGAKRTLKRVPTNWWPHRVLSALWSRRPIVKVAMGSSTELYRTGNCTYCACIAKVAFLSTFQFFL